MRQRKANSPRGRAGEQFEKLSHPAAESLQDRRLAGQPVPVPDPLRDAAVDNAARRPRRLPWYRDNRTDESIPMSSPDNEPVVVRRDVEGLMVPSGIPVTIPLDSLVYITQAMGGSFTVYFDGNLVRVPGIDADALGKDSVKPPALPENATDEQFEAIVWEQLKTIYDPEIPINIVSSAWSRVPSGACRGQRASASDDSDGGVQHGQSWSRPGRRSASFDRGGWTWNSSSTPWARK
jgi:hypothetical protein